MCKITNHKTLDFLPPLDPKTHKMIEKGDRYPDDEGLNEMFDLLGLTTDEAKIEWKNFLQHDPSIRAGWEKYKIVSESAVLKSLTKDEIDLIEHLKKTGELEKLQVSSELSMRSVGAKQIRDAIADMDQYTDVVQKQLTSHRAHMARNLSTVQSGEGRLEDRAAVLGGKEKELAKRKSILQQSVKYSEALIEGRAASLADMIRTAPSELDLPPGFKTDILETRFDINPSPYDHLLQKLQGIGWEIKCESPQNEVLLKTARHLASEEVFMLVQACRTSLNVAFRDACRSYSEGPARTADYPRAIETELMAIMDEIQSLWDEVVPVAHMAVERQLLEPIFRRVNMKNEEERAHRCAISLYISACLSAMNERLRVLASRLAVAVYHHQSMFTAFQNAKLATAPNTDKEARITETTLRVAEMSEKQREASPLALIEKSIKQFGSFKFPNDPSPGRPMKQATMLNEFVQKRSEAGNETYANVHRLYEAAVKAGLNDKELSCRMLLDCITSDSLIGAGERGSALRDAQTEESIKALQAEREMITNLIDNLNICGTRKVDKSLSPFLKSALRRLDDNYDSGGCWETHREDMTCAKCMNLTKVVEMVQNWGEEK